MNPVCFVCGSKIDPEKPWGQFVLLHHPDNLYCENCYSDELGRLNPIVTQPVKDSEMELKICFNCGQQIPNSEEWQCDVDYPDRLYCLDCEIPNCAVLLGRADKIVEPEPKKEKEE